VLDWDWIDDFFGIGLQIRSVRTWLEWGVISGESVLVKTSNRSTGILQHLKNRLRARVSYLVSEWVSEWVSTSEYLRLYNKYNPLYWTEHFRKFHNNCQTRFSWAVTHYSTSLFGSLLSLVVSRFWTHFWLFGSYLCYLLKYSDADGRVLTENVYRKSPWWRNSTPNTLSVIWNVYIDVGLRDAITRQFT